MPAFAAQSRHYPVQTTHEYRYDGVSFPGSGRETTQVHHTSEQRGITVPSSVVTRADEVIE